MMRDGKIISIEEVAFGEGTFNQYEGYQISTSDQVIKVGISNYQSCCERWGYLMSEDNLQDFVGANLLSVSVVDQLLSKREIEELEYLDCGSAMFVNFETSNGLLQFVAYNSHNGYYGHDAVLISKQLSVSETL